MGRSIKHQPTLSLVYLPHLDYGLQKFGPGAPEMDVEIQRIDTVVGDLIDFFDPLESRGSFAFRVWDFEGGETGAPQSDFPRERLDHYQRRTGD